MAAPFVSQVEVRFRHCGPAGIVFYPRYFEMINDFVEEWFDKGMGLPFHALHVERHIGTPMASVTTSISPTPPTTTIATLSNLSFPFIPRAS